MNLPKTILQLTYDPKTQLGLILRVRARLGDHFELRFQPIGANGKGKKKVKEEVAPISVLPAELVDYITMLLIKLYPTEAETKTLFSFAASSPFFRKFIESETLERAITNKVLGAVHSRSREERRLGLERDVVGRYHYVLSFLDFQDDHIESLQLIADWNAEIYEKRKEKAYYPFIPIERDFKEEEEEEEESSSQKRRKIDPLIVRLIDKRHISAWPWWYFRLLGNYHSLVSITNPITMKGDLFSASVVYLSALQRNFWEGPSHLRTLSDAKMNRISNPGGRSFLLSVGGHERQNYQIWGGWSAAADLMIIPMDKLVDRAVGYTYEIGRTMDLQGSTKLLISVSESMPTREAPIDPRSYYNPKDGRKDGRASYRKEVAITGLKNLQKKIVRHIQHEGKATEVAFELDVVLQVQHAYLGTGWNEFLEHKLGARAYLLLVNLRLQHVYFENQASLDLTGITQKFLSYLNFGPTNLSQVPKLHCPSPYLKKLQLSDWGFYENNILLWDLSEINPETCFPMLQDLSISGNVKIWEAPLVYKFSKFPNLKTISLWGFRGNEDDLLRLASVLELSPQSGTPEGVVVVVSVRGLFSIIENRKFKGVKFRFRYY